MSLDVSPHLYLVSSCPLGIFCTCPVNAEGSRLYSTAHSSGLTWFSPQVQHRYIKHSRVHLLTRGSKPNSESLEQGKELMDSHTGKGQGWSSGMAGSRGFHTIVGSLSLTIVRPCFPLRWLRSEADFSHMVSSSRCRCLSF